MTAFIKMHGLGNDFVVFDARKKPLKLSPAQARAVADRRFGIGCDQVIVMEKAKKADVFMRIYNADGGEVAACGNATRCIAWLVMEETGKKEVTVQTKAITMHATRKGKHSVTVDMGKPEFDWKKIPLAQEKDVMKLPIAAGNWKHPVAVSMGNPHMVFVAPDVHKVPLATIGPKLEKHPLFPKRVNVSFAAPVGKSKIRLRTWERGAGETLACGTAACAALVALHSLGLINDSAEVVLPGGSLDIRWDMHTNHVMMTGEVAISFTGDVPL